MEKSWGDPVYTCRRNILYVNLFIYLTTYLNNTAKPPLNQQRWEIVSVEVYSRIGMKRFLK